MKTTVSVVIPTYNRRDYVTQAIDSVLAQTVCPIEIIVVDDGSTDGTNDVLKRHYGNKIEYVWQENRGISAARNRGVEIAQGAYVAFLDSDDLWMPEKMEQQTSYLVRGGYHMVYCSAMHMDEHGQLLDLPPMPADVDEGEITFASLCLSDRVQAGGSTVMMSTQVYRQLGGFDEQIHLGEDWDMWMRISRDHLIGYQDRPLALIRRHSGAVWGWQGKRSPEQIDERLEAEERMFARLFAQADKEGLSDLRDRAMAASLRRAALMDCGIGRSLLASQRFAQADRLDPADAEQRRIQAQELVQAVRVAAETAKHPLRFGMSRVRQALSCWPEEPAQNAETSKWLMAELAESLFFSPSRRQGLGVALGCFFTAAITRTRLLSNRGAYARLVQEGVVTIKNLCHRGRPSARDQ